MPDAIPELLAAAMLAAADVGLRNSLPGTPPWTRLACPICGAALNLPAPPLSKLPAAAAARRVGIFICRHRPDRRHR